MAQFLDGNTAAAIITLPIRAARVVIDDTCFYDGRALLSDEHQACLGGRLNIPRCTFTLESDSQANHGQPTHHGSDRKGTHQAGIDGRWCSWIRRDPCSASRDVVGEPALSNARGKVRLIPASSSLGTGAAHMVRDDGRG